MPVNGEIKATGILSMYLSMNFCCILFHSLRPITSASITRDHPENGLLIRGIDEETVIHITQNDLVCQKRKTKPAKN